jgi:hypothetical protein
MVEFPPWVHAKHFAWSHSRSPSLHVHLRHPDSKFSPWLYLVVIPALATLQALQLLYIHSFLLYLQTHILHPSGWMEPSSSSAQLPAPRVIRDRDTISLISVSVPHKFGQHPGSLSDSQGVPTQVTCAGSGHAPNDTLSRKNGISQVNIVSCTSVSFQFIIQDEFPGPL